MAHAIVIRFPFSTCVHEERSRELVRLLGFPDDFAELECLKLHQPAGGRDAQISFIMDTLISLFRLFYMEEFDWNFVMNSLGYLSDGVIDTHHLRCILNDVLQRYDNPSNVRKSLFELKREFLKCWIEINCEETNLPYWTADTSAVEQAIVSNDDAFGGYLSFLQNRINRFCAFVNQPFSTGFSLVATENNCNYTMPLHKQCMGYCTQNGIQLRHVGVAEHGKYGRGIVSVEPVKPGSEVIKVPEPFVFNIYSALQSPGFNRVAVHLLQDTQPLKDEENDQYHDSRRKRRHSDSSTSNHTALTDVDTVCVLFLLYEKMRGGESSFAFMISMFPAEDSTSMHNFLLAPIEAVDATRCPLVKECVTESLACLTRLYEKLFPVLSNMFPTICPPEYFTFKLFLWAKTVLDSRSFAIPIWPPCLSFVSNGTEYALTNDVGATSAPLVIQYRPIENNNRRSSDCAQRSNICRGTVTFETKTVCFMPIADMFNHNPAGQCGMPYFDSTTRCLTVKCEAEVSSIGTELHISYGPLRTWESLVYYGFCTPDINPFDTVLLNLSEVYKFVTKSLMKQVILKNYGISENFILRPSPPYFDRSLLTLLRAAFMAEDNELDFSSFRPDSEVDKKCLTCIEDAVSALLEERLTANKLLDQFHGAAWYSQWGSLIREFSQGRVETLKLLLDDLQNRRLQSFSF